MNDGKNSCPLAVLLDGPPADFAAEVRLAAGLGFTHVDVVAPLEERPAADLERWPTPASWSAAPRSAAAFRTFARRILWNGCGGRLPTPAA